MKKKDKHTPGPWFHYTGKLRPQYATIIHEIQSDDGTSIVKWGGFDGVDGSQRKIVANARLMAAAPEMLAALRKAMPVLMNFADGSEGAYEIVCDAISKAERGPSTGPDK
jgi:hypothetical protein